jgi:anti-sigma factor RsiW
MTSDLMDACCAEEAARLLPWYVTGRLVAADVERVEQHLERCAICRADVTHERGLRASIKADARIEYAPQAGLAKTLARIDELGRDAPSTAPTSVGRPRASRRVQWLAAAVVVQAVGIAVLGGVLASHRSADAARPTYATLSSADGLVPGRGHLRAVFAPGVTLADLKDALSARQLTIVRGPSDAGVYTLASTDSGASPAALESTIASLRTDSRVLFVERAVNDEAVAR